MSDCSPLKCPVGDPKIFVFVRDSLRLELLAFDSIVKCHFWPGTVLFRRMLFMTLYDCKDDEM